MKWLRRLFAPAVRPRPSTPRRTRPTLEALGDRQVPSQFVVAAELPGKGVYRFFYDDRGSFSAQRLTPLNATQVAADDDGDVAAAFPNQGVWRYRDLTGWQQLTASNVTQLAMAGGGAVVVENPGYGVWRYLDATGW
jgi:hypothetical protein